MLTYMFVPIFHIQTFMLIHYNSTIYFFFYLVCKSCLVKHLEENNSCPTCQIVIHQSHPLQYISFDRTMQDIVFKLVPGLQLGIYNYK